MTPAAVLHAPSLSISPCHHTFIRSRSHTSVQPLPVTSDGARSSIRNCCVLHAACRGLSSLYAPSERCAAMRPYDRRCISSRRNRWCRSANITGNSIARRLRRVCNQDTIPEVRSPTAPPSICAWRGGWISTRLSVRTRIARVIQFACTLLR